MKFFLLFHIVFHSTFFTSFPIITFLTSSPLLYFVSITCFACFVVDSCSTSCLTLHLFSFSCVLIFLHNPCYCYIVFPLLSPLLLSCHHCSCRVACTIVARPLFIDLFLLLFIFSLPINCRHYSLYFSEFLPFYMVVSSSLHMLLPLVCLLLSIIG